MDRREFVKRCSGASAAFAAATESKQETQGQQVEQFYAIVELMGYNKLAGRVTTSGCLWRIDVPVPGGFSTQFFNPQNVYRITVTDEKCVADMMKGADPLPAVTLEPPVTQRRLGYGNGEDDGFGNWDGGF